MATNNNTAYTLLIQAAAAESRRLTGVNSVYKAPATMMSSIATMTKLTMPAKNRRGEWEMLCAVRDALPGMISGTKAPKLPNPPSTAIMARETPATWADVRGDHAGKLSGFRGSGALIVSSLCESRLVRFMSIPYVVNL